MNENIKIKADVVVLATAVVPHPEARNVAKLFKLPVDSDGFLMEAHAKLRPVEFSVDGVFLAGLAHYPKPIEETIAQAKAAASRAACILTQPTYGLGPVNAEVDVQKCDGCAVCIDICPFGAIELVDLDPAGNRKSIRINAALCKGCGGCQASCPKDGVNVVGFTYRQIAAQIGALLS